MPEFYLEDTIAAIATPSGEGGLAVIRISGPEAFSLIRKIFKPKHPARFSALEAQTIHFGSLCHGEGLLDQVMVSVFKKPYSYTGDDVIEVSSHGGVIVSRRVLDLICQSGARPAEPGEFTKRAFLNGKIDLTQAEAVLDLIKAKSEKSLETALRQLTGQLSHKFQEIKKTMMQLYAHMEAFLDFPDEDLEIFEDTVIRERMGKVEKELDELVMSFKRGVLMREGARLVLVGRPNVGKSSLFNALLARDRALVSEIPGTTRDHLEEALEIGGIYIRLIDTAGIGSSDNVLDRMGVQRTEEVLQSGDIFLFLIDVSESLTHLDSEAYGRIPKGKPILVVLNKFDLPARLDQKMLMQMTGDAPRVTVSSKTREGLQSLEQQIEILLNHHAPAVEGEQVTRLRHKLALESAREAWRRAAASFEERRSLEIVILDLKESIDQLREIVGEIYSEDLLDVIFSEFCIGK